MVWKANKRSPQDWDLRGKDYNPSCLHCKRGVAHSQHRVLGEKANA